MLLMEDLRERLGFGLWSWSDGEGIGETEYIDGESGVSSASSSSFIAGMITTSSSPSSGMIHKVRPSRDVHGGDG